MTQSERQAERTTRHILTIDVEDWYLAHLEFFADSPVGHDEPPDRSVISGVSKFLDLLDETQNRATFFVLGSVAKHYPEIVQEIVARGHEIASHGYLHRWLYNLTPEDFEADLLRSLDALAAAGAPEVKGFRAPCFSVTRRTIWALDIIKKCGLVYDSSIFPVWRRLYGIADWPREPTLLANGLWEFPLATTRFLGWNFAVAGGGYLRMLPYGPVAAAIRGRSLCSPGVFYFHPYELEPSGVALRHRPRRMYTRLVAGFEKLGLNSSPWKIRRLLTEFKFDRLDKFLPPDDGKTGGDLSR